MDVRRFIRSWMKKQARYGPLLNTVGTEAVYHMRPVPPKLKAVAPKWLRE
jgi:hypothetical protein